MVISKLVVPATKSVAFVTVRAPVTAFNAVPDGSVPLATIAFVIAPFPSVTDASTSPLI